MAWPAAGAASPTTEYPRTETYSDTSGDGGSAADVSTVSVMLDAQDALTFTITEANRSAFVSPDSMAILIDTDVNATTGAPGGAEYRVLVDPGTVKLESWNGTAFADSSAQQLTVSSSGGQVVVHVRCDDLGFPGAIAFVVQTSADALATVGDSAPDTPTTWQFALETTAKVTASPLQLSKARAGQLFAASMSVEVTFEPAFTLRPTRHLEGGTTICSATLAGRPLRAVRKSFAADRGSCVWRLPRTAHGKVLRGRVQIAVAEGLATRPFAVKVA